MATAVAACTFHLMTGRTVIAGEVFDSSDPVVKGREQLFSINTDAPVVEQATAAPGEVRTTPRKSSARKAAAKPKG